MKGKYRVVVQNASVKFDFTIRRNITILKGDSATGKTTLVEMVREHYERGDDSGVEIVCDKQCVSLSGRDWKILLNAYKDSIVFIDEGNDFVLGDDFARMVEHSDNYYVIVTREGLPNLPYSTEEIYGIRMSGKYGGLKPVYNEFYRIYGSYELDGLIIPDIVVVEDTNSGYEFYQGISDKSYTQVISAGGKTKIQQIVKSLPDDNVLIIADGAAFGAEIGRVMSILKHRKHTWIYLPESFEWIILKSGRIDGKAVEDILNHPEDYIESSQYFSWEQFFTHLLIQQTVDTYLHYRKAKLNQVYLSESFERDILAVMEHIHLTK